MSYVLAIIDVQESYPWGRDDDYTAFAEDVVKIVEKAVRDEVYIIVLELVPVEDRTIAPVRKVLEGYRKQSLVSSKRRDKHLDIWGELSKEQIAPEYVLIIGANADECILETVKGALKFEEFPPIRIGPIHTFNMENEVDKMHNFCWAIEKLEKLENRYPERLQIGGDQYLWYETYMEELEEENSN